MGIKEKFWKNYRTFVVVLSIFFLFLFIIVFSFGVYVSSKCTSIGSCKACWNEGDYTEKNNAYVDLILCACTSARAKDYKDTAVNENIIGAYVAISGFSSDARSICEGAVPMSKVYDDELNETVVINMSS